MSAAKDALREAAAAEQARYAKPFVDGPRPQAATAPIRSSVIPTDSLGEIGQRRRELLADVDESRTLRVVRVSA